jgi:hypothetical protein
MEISVISLEDAAKILSVSIETLLQWNELNILKPSITPTGQIGYDRRQIEQFLLISRQSKAAGSDGNQLSVSDNAEIKPFPTTLFFTLVVSFLVTSVISQIFMLKFIPDEAESSKQVLSAQTSVSPEQKSVSNLPKSPAYNPIELKNNIVSDLANDMTGSNLTYSQIANFPVNVKTSDQIFDQGGNIKGEAAGTDLLATTMFTNGLVNEAKAMTNTVDANMPIVLLTLFLLCLPFIFKKQSRTAAIAYDGDGSEKVLELNQRPDGAIVLCFQGREYKVCKPELDSESDQFVDRLLGMAAPGTKEIDYDASNDEEVSFNAPLSKLVTRLGFVGVKRDLFFPRTSKNRVLFRKYLTQDDLAAMGLRVDQITDEFLASG